MVMTMLILVASQSVVCRSLVCTQLGAHRDSYSPWKLVDKSFPKQAAERHHHPDIEPPLKIPERPDMNGQFVLISKLLHRDVIG
jgi:hypothetical protein